MTTINKKFLGLALIYSMGVPLALVNNVAIARSLTQEDFGNFSYVISLATVLAIPIAGGLTTLLNREVAKYTHRGEWRLLRGIINSSYIYILSFSTFLTIFTYILKLTNYEITAYAYAAVFLVPLFGINAVRIGALRGLSHPILSEIPNQILLPLLSLFGYLLLNKINKQTIGDFLGVYIGATIIVLTISTIFFYRIQPKEITTRSSSYEDLPNWLRALIPFITLGAVGALSSQVGVLLLGIAGENQAVAQLRVADRLTQLIVLPLYLINIVVPNYIIAAHQDNDLDKIKTIARNSARAALILSAPVIIALTFWSDQIISATFGYQYATSVNLPILILLFAQTVSVSLGPSGAILSMTGHEKITLMSQAVGLSVTVLLAQLCIGEHGAVGMAFAMACGIIINRSIEYYVVIKKLGISSAIF